MLKRTTKPLSRRVLIEEGLAKSSKKQHSENTDKWHLCKAGSFSYGESPRTPPLEGTSIHRWNNSVKTLRDLEPVYHLCMIVCEITLPLAATSGEHAPESSVQNMHQKSSWEKRRGLQNAEQKLVLGFLHSVNHTGSPQDESYIHSYFIPGQNNKSSKRKFFF